MIKPDKVLLLFSFFGFIWGLVAIYMGGRYLAFLPFILILFFIPLISAFAIPYEHKKIKDNNQKNINECKRLVNQFFTGNEEKTEIWFKTPNPTLGNLTPNWLFEMGKSYKVLQFIKYQLRENCPPKDIYDILFHMLGKEDAKVNLWWFAYNSHLSGVPADVYLEDGGAIKIREYLFKFVEK